MQFWKIFLTGFKCLNHIVKENSIVFFTVKWTLFLKNMFKSKHFNLYKGYNACETNLDFQMFILCGY